MINIPKLLAVLIIFNTLVFPCDLCRNDIPTVNVYIEMENKKDLTAFNIKWLFEKDFISKLDYYDTNEDKIFDENEKQNIKDAFIKYLEQHNYLTQIIYSHKNKKNLSDHKTEIELKDSEFILDKNVIVFNYVFEKKILLLDDHQLSIKLYDKNNNFNFVIKDIKLNNYNGFKIIEPQIFSCNIYFFKKSYNTSDLNNIIGQSVDNKEERVSFYDMISDSMNKIKESLKILLEDIRSNNSLSSYFWLLLFSFGYGVIHAMGPGHGKSLISAYFLSSDRSYTKALKMSSLIGIVHTFSAFLMTLSVYYLVGVIFSGITADIEKYASRTSAVLIIFIALYLLYKKIKPKKNKLKFTISPQQSIIQPNNIPHNNRFSCSCSGCKTKSDDIMVILAAGMIPCPGTVTVFIFTMGLGIYFVGFLSAVFMSMGMAFIIFITSLISIKLKRTAKSNNFISTLLEFASLIFILLLGIILLFA